MTQHPDSAIRRLNRIEGQVRGIKRMIEEERYCVDILIQMQAVKAALGRVEDEILKSHAAHCVEDAIASGDAEDQREKFDELVTLVRRFRA